MSRPRRALGRERSPRGRDVARVVSDVPTRSLRAGNERRCERILARSRPLEVDDLPWDRHDADVVDDAVIDALVYMRDVEGFTDRELVGFTAHRNTLADPLIRSFLDVWRAEEAAHADALDRFLGWYGERHGRAIPARQPAPPALAGWHERILAHVGGPVGTIVTAAHMTWGAANEQLTLNGYRLLADRCEHTLLAELLRRIATQEARHFSFYLLQAEWRLASSRLARKALRHVLAVAWTPVGVGDGYKSTEEFARLIAYLGGDAAGSRAVARMDRRFAALPGLGGLRIYAAAASTTATA